MEDYSTLWVNFWFFKSCCYVIITGVTADDCSTIGVVYFDQLSGAGHTQKVVKQLFPAVFNLFCSFQTFFSDFTPEINKKTPQNEQKRNLFSYFAYSSKLVYMQKLVDSLRAFGWFVFRFLTFLVFFSFSDVFCVTEFVNGPLTTIVGSGELVENCGTNSFTLSIDVTVIPQIGVSGLNWKLDID